MKKFIYVATLAFTLTIVAGDLNGVYSQQTKEVTKTKKPWSHKKKYAVIGTAVGAATGAAVSKNRVKGAIIGGAAGAGTGYVIGRHKDKKNPPPKKVVKYKKKSA